MSRWRRLYLFARDYCREFGVAWSLARTRDCERNGGHQWDASTYGELSYDETMRAWGRTCSRCGCWQSSALHTIPIPPTATNATAFNITYGGAN